MFCWSISISSYLSVVCSKLLTLMRFSAIFSDRFRHRCLRCDAEKVIAQFISTIHHPTLWLHHETIFGFEDCWNWASNFFHISICGSPSFMFSLSLIDLIECYNSTLFKFNSNAHLIWMKFCIFLFTIVRLWCSRSGSGSHIVRNDKSNI